jgi:hypothetical protein
MKAENRTRDRAEQPDLMTDQENVARFVRLDSQGGSFNRIAVELGVSKTILISVSRQQECEAPTIGLCELSGARRNSPVTGKIRSKSAKIGKRSGWPISFPVRFWTDFGPISPSAHAQDLAASLAFLACLAGTGFPRQSRIFGMVGGSPIGVLPGARRKQATNRDKSRQIATNRDIRPAGMSAFPLSRFPLFRFSVFQLFLHQPSTLNVQPSSFGRHGSPLAGQFLLRFAYLAWLAVQKSAFFPARAETSRQNPPKPAKTRQNPPSAQASPANPVKFWSSFGQVL